MIWTNKIATIIPSEDKVTLVLNEQYRKQNLNLSAEESVLLLEMYTDFVYGHITEKTEEVKDENRIYIKTD